MAEGGFDAGSILVQLRADLTDFNTGLDSAKSRLDAFGESGTAFGAAFQRGSQTFLTASNGVQQGSQKVINSLNDIGEAEIRHDARMVRLIGRFILAENAVHAFSDGTSKEATAISRALSLFGSILSVMPNEVGLVVGALAAMAVGFSAVFGPTEKETAAAKALKAELEGVDKALTSLNKQSAKGEKKSALEQTFSLAPTKSDESIKNDELLKERENQIERLLTLEDKEKLLEKENAALFAERNKAEESSVAGINVLGRNVSTINDAIKTNQKDLKDVRVDIDDTTKSLTDANKAAKDFTSTFEAATKRDSLIKAFKDQLNGFSAQLAANKDDITNGLIDPLDGAKREADIFIARAKAILEFQEKIAQLPDAVKKNLPTIDQALITQGTQSFRDKEAQKAAGEFASGLSRAVGDGISQGILSGEKPMAILAGVGQNLFSNFLQKTVDQFEKSMVKAFESIGGQGGEILGGLLTAGLGVAGALLGKKQNSSSFNPVQSAVTSTAAVRGIVAGPSSVAIADVGDNLARALAPMFQKQDATNGWLQKIESNTRGRGAGPGAFPAVAAPTA